MRIKNKFPQTSPTVPPTRSTAALKKAWPRLNTALRISWPRPRMAWKTARTEWRSPVNMESMELVSSLSEEATDGIA